jgi:hypothetical protein
MDAENENSRESVDSVSSVDPELNEDRALSLLKNPNLPAVEIEHLTAHPALMKSRKVRLALAAHPRTPRRIALRLIREFYTFDLMQFALRPTAAADLKRLADDLLVARLPSITLGERIALARRCSSNVGTALLLDREPRVWQTALSNPRLTEAGIIKALQRHNATPAFVDGVCHHPKWSVRPEIRVALLRSAHTPLARAIDFARNLAPPHLRDILYNSKLPENIKQCLRKHSVEKPSSTDRGSPRPADFQDRSRRIRRFVR